MLIIRVETERDYGAVAAINTAALAQPSEARLVEELRVSPGFVRELSLVAVLDDTVGCALTELSPACYIKGGC